MWAIVVIILIVLLIIYGIYKIRYTYDHTFGAAALLIKAKVASLESPLRRATPNPAVSKSSTDMDKAYAYCSQYGTADQKQSCKNVVSSCVPYIKNLESDKKLAPKIMSYGTHMSPKQIMSGDARKLLDKMSKVKGFNNCVNSISKLDPKYVYDVVSKSGKNPKCLPGTLSADLNFDNVPKAMKKLEGPVKSFIGMYPKCTMESISA